jgi:uncharacterized membrane protein YqjE|mmetsp:Transcript_70426/g.117615  ORF Transcript_70426/g.117615 Transcript_70426/m.117615 type:complete len:281 (-) Transcript_70426:1045-1887(-)|eukprot:CAMPEP_0174284648 /NCGR_PEP_ID=MMETSP0809-20121228/6296_1 /TAXON_ID=73025 ORGANISM="Eutreptiella gymnastica-like, Strain CCMP1594" /NCGR_SAMPLE_ID=MMETSP0809 /ASSEMBLY_ACC=CAM_ASM_000658 /LENGTH=280 /DNA_ID=CAMNT_0015380227 /DNA_START=38 /DNA_END=880 /DNA_ORIENTATION=+
MQFGNMARHNEPHSALKLPHPALKLLKVAFVFVGLSALLGFISAFVPWAQRDFGSVTAWFYPFKWCAELKTSPLHYTQCEDEDLGGWTASSITGFSVPLAGNKKCRGFFIATIVFVFIHVIFAVLGLVALLLLISKLWTKVARTLAPVVTLLLFISFAGTLCSWVMFIVYAEELCSADTVNSVDVFPVRGYSYGFICQIFATSCGLLALILGCMGQMKVFKPLDPHQPEGYTPAYPSVYLPVATGPDTPSHAPYLNGYVEPFPTPAEYTSIPLQPMPYVY